MDGYRKLHPQASDMAWNFACDMINDGHIKSSRNGGELNRGLQQKCIDTFQGKLAEFAFYGLCKEKNIDVPKPDCSIMGLGEYDDGDFCVHGKNISIKSVKPNARYLLLETKSYNNEGLETIFSSPKKNDFICLIKIGYFDRGRMRFIQDFVKKHGNNPLGENNSKFQAQFSGFITYDDFLQIIKEKKIFHKGEALGSSSILDASNYYCHTDNLRKSNELWRMI